MFSSQDILRETGQVRILKLTTDPNEFCLVLTTDYIEHVGKPTENKTLAKTVIGANQSEACKLHFCSFIYTRCILGKFLGTVVEKYRDVSINRETMEKEFRFNDEDLT